MKTLSILFAVVLSLPLGAAPVATAPKLSPVQINDVEVMPEGAIPNALLPASLQSIGVQHPAYAAYRLLKMEAKLPEELASWLTPDAGGEFPPIAQFVIKSSGYIGQFLYYFTTDGVSYNGSGPGKFLGIWHYETKGVATHRVQVGDGTDFQDAASGDYAVIPGSEGSWEDPRGFTVLYRAIYSTQALSSTGAKRVIRLKLTQPAADAVK